MSLRAVLGLVCFAAALWGAFAWLATRDGFLAFATIAAILSTSIACLALLDAEKLQ